MVIRVTLVFPPLFMLLAYPSLCGMLREDVWSDSEVCLVLVVWGESTVLNGHQMARNSCIFAVRGVNLGTGHADVVTS